MSSDRNRHMSMLARASRVAGHQGQFHARTRYLTSSELRTVPASRLLRETAWAERPDATDEWRDQRREVLADEFDRRGFADAAGSVRPRWDDPDYDGQRLLEQQRQHEAERRELDEERTSEREESTVAWAVATLVGAGAMAEIVDGDEVMEQVTGGLDQAWEGSEADPAISGDLDMTTGADLADSLSAVADPAAADTSLDAEPPVPTPETSTEAEL